MKENCFNRRIAPFFSGFFIVIFFISVAHHQACGQSTIYKKDGTTIRAFQLDTQGATRSYKTSIDTTGMIHYISWKAIDSIRYEDGTMERFNSGVLLPVSELPVRTEGKNLIGVNIWPYFYGDIEFFYERLLSDHIGFKTNLLYRPGERDWYGVYYHSVVYTINSGINYYFLESELFRFGTGAAFAFGKFNEEHIEEYMEYDPYMDYYYPSYIYSFEEKAHSTVYINGSFTFKFTRFLFASVELDIPLLMNQPYEVLFKTEVAINF